MKNLILIILTVYVYSQTYTIEANDFTNKKVNFKSINFNNDTNFLEVNISSYLSKPNNTKTMPAVILLHGCTGLGRHKYKFSWNSLRQHAKILNENKYVTLIIDSHGSRKINYEKALRKSCSLGNTLGFYERTGDVYGAVKFLQSKDYINKEKIIVFGQSQGAMVVLNSLNSTNYNDQYKIAAGIGYYPHCAYPNIPDSLYAPIILFTGGRDNVTPEKLCINYVNNMKNKGESIFVPKIISYENVHHAFDYLTLGKSYQTSIGIIAPNGKITKKTREEYFIFLNNLFTN
jgi:dienelactone hydrolase